MREGPGTSDLDLTLIGGEALKLFRLDGFYVPGLHSRPLSDKRIRALRRNSFRCDRS